MPSKKRAEWYEAHREERAVQKREWRVAHADHVREYNAEYRRTHPAKRRDLRLAYYHDVTPAELEALYRDQGGRCAICDLSAPMRGPGCLHIDHDHVSGVRRGLLCHACNSALNAVDRLGASWVLRALAYLSDPPLPRLRTTAAKATAGNIHGGLVALNKED